ncbi:RHS repeat-associated core domain-containing protein, partial [Chryseobacterium taichungense]|uniref:RHS repeat-associated core domain-containing protein n=1 Tax=Chryseobacterium taichungense TaxID=295069 RepID=UPI0028AC8C4A
IKYENPAKIYQPTGMTLNAAGEQNYNNDLIQSIAYNENNDPVFIDGMKGDVAFQYGLSSMRQRVTYGGNFSIDGDGKFTKFYSEDGSFEVLKDNITGKEKHILYIGGNPYDSNIVYLKNFDETGGSYKFLHKDYIGSILAISDEAGNKLEQRHFDAWGNFTHLQIGNGAVITDKNIIANSSLLVDRGYTSHEHFAEVGIIHMNGRLYDPLLRRFLNADENIQDPYNTQNYNKYGYVLNNPLMFNDPSGEFFGLPELVSAMVIATIIAGFSYTVMTAVTGANWDLGQFLKANLFAAASAAVTYGIGSIFVSSAGTSTQIAQELGKLGTIFVQGTAHALAQGILSLVQGQGFGSAFVSGFLGSIGASAFTAAAGKFANSAVGTIASGAVLGGVGSELTGGNFWQGALIGGVVAGFNHVMHEMDGGPGKGTNDWLGDGKDVVYNGDAWFGSNYIGPGPDVDPNTLLKAGLKPLDMVDQAAFKHDVAYYNANTGGIKGAMFEKAIAYADNTLAKDAKNVINGYKRGNIDPVTGQKISQRTYNMAKLVYAAFKTISYQKSARINIDTKISHFYNTIINQIPRSIR